MLILTRHPGQRITLKPHPALRPATPIARLFAVGPIEILVTRVCGQRVSLGITADAGFVIYRNEVGEAHDDNGQG